MSWRNELKAKIPTRNTQDPSIAKSALGGFAFVTEVYTNTTDPNREGAIQVSHPNGKSNTHLVYPISYSNRVLPVKGELVPIYYEQATGTYFYGNPVNIHNYPNHNAVSNLVQDTNGFSESTKVNPYRTFPGDVILEGRSGQSIRFSQTAKGLNAWSEGSTNGESVIILSSGQQNVGNSYSLNQENFDRDAAVLVLLENGKLKYDGATAYEGNQALLISDRVHIKARNENIDITSNEEINLQNANWSSNLTEILDLIEMLIRGGNIVPNGLTGINSEALQKLLSIKSRITNV